MRLRLPILGQRFYYWRWDFVLGKWRWCIEAERTYRQGKGWAPWVRVTIRRVRPDDWDW